MRKILLLFPLFTLHSSLLTSVAQPSPRRQCIDSIATLGLMPHMNRCADFRQWMADCEKAVGYEAFLQEFNNMIRKAKIQATRSGLFTDLPMVCDYMAWQQGTLSDEQAGERLRYHLEDYAHGLDSVYTAQGKYGKGREYLWSPTYVCMRNLLVDFLCRTGQFSEAKELHKPLWDYLYGGKENAKKEPFEWTWLRNRVEEIAVCMGENAFVGANLAAWHCSDSQPKKWQYLKVDFEKLGIDYEESVQGVSGIAPYVLPAMLPLPAKAYKIVQGLPTPWPLTVFTLNPSEQMRLSVLSYYEALLCLPFSDVTKHYVARIVFDNSIHLVNYDTPNVSPEALAALLRRDAEIYQLSHPIENYPHDETETILMRMWRRTMIYERMAYGHPSAQAMLAYAMCWLRKGYPLNMLPLFEDAVDAMRTELNITHPTSRQMLLNCENRRWLREELPQIISLTQQIEVYASIISSLKALAAE